MRNAQMKEALDVWTRGSTFNVVSFGKWLAKVRDRMVDGLVVRAAGKNHQAVQWFVDKC